MSSAKDGKRSSAKDTKDAKGKKGKTSSNALAKAAKGASSPTGVKRGKSSSNALAQAAAAKDDEKKQESTGTEIELPKSSDFDTKVAAMKVFPTMYETDVNDIRDTFDVFVNLLKERREAVLKEAQEKVDKRKFDNVVSPAICIDRATIDGRINNIGSDLGPKWYELERSKYGVCDRVLELIACEEKLQYVNGDFTKTKSVKGLKNAIGKVEAELKETEPVLNAAKDAVKDISKGSLDEIRVLKTPHQLLINAVKACALLVGTPEKEIEDWSSIRKILKTSFINDLISFDGANVQDSTIKKIEKEYLGRGNDDMKADDKLTFDNVKKVNAVAGSLVLWLEAQLKYNEMLPLVTAKQAELKELKLQLAMMDGSSADLSNAIKILETRVKDGKAKIRKLIAKYEKMQREYDNACTPAEA